MKMPPLLRAARLTGVALTWLMVPGLRLSAADVATYTIEKRIQYYQTGPEAPTPDDKNGAIFELVVKNTTDNLVTGVQVRIPNGPSTTVPADGRAEFQLREKFNTLDQLETDFPNGAYLVTIQTVHDGLQAPTLSLTGDRYPSLAPRLSNFPDTQSMDAGAYFLFTWDALADGGPDDYVQLRIEDGEGAKVWETPDLGKNGALDGRATAALMPGRTLTAGQTYYATLDFARASQRDLSSYPGALGAALYCKRTKFTIQTSPVSSQANVKVYAVSKSRRFLQTGATAPAPQDTKTFNINAEVDAATAGAVAGASLLLPNGTAQALKAQPDNQSLEFSDDKRTQPSLDAIYPNGVFTFQIGTATGMKSLSLPLTGDAYPNAPHLLALPGTVDPVTDCVVSWEPFEEGTASDFCQLRIEDDQGNKAFETPDFGKSGALNGYALTAVVPRDTLRAGQTYTARVVFQKNRVLDPTSYPGALGVASYATRTTFTFSTRSSDQTPPRLAALAAPSPGEFRLLVQAAGGATVRIEHSSDLRDWAPLTTVTLPTSGETTVTDSSTGAIRSRFYRALLGP
jgi:hypothetical protein